MRQVTVRPRQTIYDICIQEYGTLEQLSKLITDNRLMASYIANDGDILLVEPNGFGVDPVKDYFLNRAPHNNFPFETGELVTLSRADITLANASITLATLYA